MGLCQPTLAMRVGAACITATSRRVMEMASRRRPSTLKVEIVVVFKVDTPRRF
jgi:hypothetical protein